MNNCGINIPWTGKDIIGLTNERNSDICNSILLVPNYYIYLCECKNQIHIVYGALESLKYYFQIEK